MILVVGGRCIIEHFFWVLSHYTFYLLEFDGSTKRSIIPSAWVCVVFLCTINNVAMDFNILLIVVGIHWEPFGKLRWLYFARLGCGHGRM